MPAYDYRCTACSKRFEITRSASDSADVSCPDCGAPTKRVFTPVGVVFKGSGFYSTDNQRGRAADAAPSTEGSKDQSKDSPVPATPPCASADKDGACAGCPAAADG